MFLIFNIGRVKMEEFYTNSPVQVVFSTLSPEFESQVFSFEEKLSICKKQPFSLLTSEGDSLGTFTFRTPITFEGSTFVVLPRDAERVSKGFRLLVQVTPSCYPS